MAKLPNWRDTGISRRQWHKHPLYIDLASTAPSNVELLAAPAPQMAQFERCALAPTAVGLQSERYDDHWSASRAWSVIIDCATLFSSCSDAWPRASDSSLTMLDWMCHNDVGITYRLSRAIFCSDVGFDRWTRLELEHRLLSSGMVASESVELAPFVAESVVARVRFKRTACMRMGSRTR